MQPIHAIIAIISGLVCAAYLIIPVVLGVWYIKRSANQKTPTKTDLIIKNIIYPIIILMSGIIIFAINHGLESFILKHLENTNDFTTAFVLLNSMVLLSMVIIGSILRLLRANIAYIVQKKEEDESAALDSLVSRLNKKTNGKG